MRHVLFILILTFTVNVYGQNRIDSLSRTILATEPSSTVLNNYNEVIKYYLPQNPDSAKLYIDQLAQLQQSDPIIEIMYVRWLGAYFSQLSEFDSAVLYYDQMLDLAEISTIDSLIAKALYELGTTYIFIGDFAKSKQYLSDALSLAEQLNYRNVIEDATYTLAVVFMYEDKFESAISTYITLDSLIRRREVVDSVFLGSILHNISYLYRQIGKYQKALTYALEAESLYIKLNAEDDLMLTRSLLAWLKTDLEDFNSAEKDFLALARYYLENKNDYSLAEVYMGLATAAQGSQNYTIAIDYCSKAEAINRRIENIINLATVLNLKGACYGKLNTHQKAIVAYKEADSLASVIELLPIKIDAMTGLANTYYDLGEFNRSSFFYREISPLKDSLGRSTSRKNVEELEAKYQSQKKEQAITLLTAQNMLVKQQRRQQLYVMLGIIFVISIIVIFLFYLYRNKKRTMARLKELDSQKSKIFANISHEFRTPLTLIKGPVEDELLRDNLDDNERQNLQLIDRNASRLLSLVDQLLDLSKLEAGSMHLIINEYAISPILGALLPSFKYAAERKQISFHYEIPSAPGKIWIDRDVVEKIVMNLLSNAIKYTPDNGEINVVATLDDEYLTIEVKNTGEGIKAEEISKVFDRFYQGMETQKGVGIGLALVKELVALHKGTISLASEKDGWTEFIVELPIVKHKFKSDELASITLADNTIHEIGEPETAAPVTEETKISTDAHILLVVEDNEDLRSLIKHLFEETYTVLEAKDGAEGISKAIDFIPDIIISDIMMPVKDGVELSQTLKTDERTSHIPIILLTAKAGDDNKLRGLETGADDYIIKPFSSKVLKMRVKKLIDLRSQLRLRYSQEVILRPKDIAISSADETFLERVQELFDEKLTDSSFSVESFSHEIGMSRMQLHRKLKALVGLTTTEFIRSQRLKIAAFLLETSNINMSEVGYTVGFNDPSYFARCFKESYDCTPTQYAKDNYKSN